MDKIKISTLQGQVNYADWKFQVENMLKYYDLVKIVTGIYKDEVIPVVDASAEVLKLYEEQHAK